MPTKIILQNVPTGYQTIISNERNAILGDEPLKIGGTDLGLSPTELLLCAIGMCKATTIRHIARKNGWDIKDVKAELTQEVARGENGKLATRVTTAVKIEGNITEEQKVELYKQAERCYVVRMIENQWEMEHIEELK